MLSSSSLKKNSNNNRHHHITKTIKYSSSSSSINRSIDLSIYLSIFLSQHSLMIVLNNFSPSLILQCFASSSSYSSFLFLHLEYQAYCSDLLLFLPLLHHLLIGIVVAAPVAASYVSSSSYLCFLFLNSILTSSSLLVLLFFFFFFFFFFFVFLLCLIVCLLLFCLLLFVFLTCWTSINVHTDITCSISFHCTSGVSRNGRLPAGVRKRQNTHSSCLASTCRSVLLPNIRLGARQSHHQTF